MRKQVLLVLVIGLVGSLSGCFISVKGDCGRCGRNAVVVSGEMSATMAEIDAVGSLMSESSKAQAYKALAMRSDLSEPERICLIKAVQKNLMSESSKSEILMLLIENRPEQKQSGPIKN